MSYKEKLLELHQLALSRLQDYTTAEQAMDSANLVCDVCDPLLYARKMDLYLAFQEAINQRNILAKKISEEKIDINSVYSERVNITE